MNIHQKEEHLPGIVKLLTIVVRKNVVDMVIPPSSEGSRHDVRPSKIAWTIMPGDLIGGVDA
jgi:hypothetical protein